MKRAPKYGNRKVTWNGEKFDSQAECSRYCTLLTMQRVGRISNLTRQVSFVLAPKVVINGVAKRSLIYRADFGYTDQDGKAVVEDVKGALTAVYKIKRHLMMSVHGISILETK
ncbi:MAG: DUF1064 domain-containing protein [Telluria sp.]